MAITQDSKLNLNDYLLDVDELNRPIMVNMIGIKPGKMNAAVTMIARLLYMRKGTYADHPDLGIDVRGRYRFAFEDEVQVLARELKDQIEQYLPEFTPVTVECEYKRIDKVGYVIIYLIINKVAYELVYNTDSTSLEGLEKLINGGR